MEENSRLTVEKEDGDDEGNEDFLSKRYSDELSLSQEGGTISDRGVLFNICNGITGTGILAMGFVFRCTGIWALVVVPAIAIACSYTGKVLIGLLYDVDENGDAFRAREGYLDIGEKLLPNFGRVFVNATNLVENFAHCVLIFVLIGGIMNEIIPTIDDDLWTVLLSVPLLAVIFTERIRSLSIVARVSVSVAFLMIAIATSYSLTFHSNWSKTMKTATEFELSRFSVGIGISVVTYACHPYLPFIEKDMKNKANFSKIINISFSCITIIKVISGLFIYLAYENKTNTMMTLDLPDGPLKVISSFLLIILGLTFSIFPMFTVFNIVDQNWPHSIRSAPRFPTIRYFSRLFLFELAVLFAVFIPHFGLGLSLVGNFTANLLVFIIPCVCHIKFNYPNIETRYLVTDVIILILSISLGTVGMYSSIRKLIASSNEEDLNPTEAIENL
eukprot:gene15953-17558_t